MSRKGWGKIQYALNRFFVSVSKKNKDYEAYAHFYTVFYKLKILLPLLPFYRVLHGFKNGNMTREVKALKEAKKRSK